jgi:signal transduction histidine kinase
VAEERQRMAGELHDAIGHAVSVMVVQAGAAEAMLAERPERAARALADVQQMGRNAIGELRSMLGILRSPAEEERPAPVTEPVSRPGPAYGPCRCCPKADAALALLALAAGEAYVLFDPVMSGVRAPTALVQLLAAAAIALRSRLPFAAFLLAVFAMTAESILIDADPEAPTSLLATLLTLYTVAAHEPRVRAAAAGALAVLIPCGLELRVDNGDVADLWVIAPLFALPLVAGRAVRASRSQAERLRIVTERLRRDRDARVRLALVGERTRVARELHDSIAHSVSVMVLQAGAAEAVLARAPEQARGAAQAIQQLGRHALGELERTLGMLGAGDQRSGLTPRVGLAQLDTLIADVRRAGLPVRVEVRGVPGDLPVGVDIPAYRIVQEGLTNALKHAGSVATTVVLDYGADALGVEIVDDGGEARSASLAGTGHGLIGMQERVVLYGGTLDAGPLRGGGYAVRASLIVGDGVA